jgi:hypothetical protein
MEVPADGFTLGFPAKLPRIAGSSICGDSDHRFPKDIKEAWKPAHVLHAIKHEICIVVKHAQLVYFCWCALTLLYIPQTSPLRAQVCYISTFRKRFTLKDCHPTPTGVENGWNIDHPRVPLLNLPKRCISLDTRVCPNPQRPTRVVPVS